MLPLVAVLTSVEGTTTPLRMIRTVLFPFARDRLPAFLSSHADHPAVAGAVAEVLRLVPGRPALQTLLHWMDQDAKVTPLKALQGMIWREGFRVGELADAIYPDVPPALRRWAAAGLRLCSFSHGSTEAQRLMFSHAPGGDIGPLFAGIFDTRVGAKRDPDSFSRLAIGLGLPPAEILYVSDQEEELDAAAAAGMRTCQVLRDGEGGVPTDRHPATRDFPEVARRMGLPRIDCASSAGGTPGKALQSRMAQSDHKN